MAIVKVLNALGVRLGSSAANLGLLHAQHAQMEVSVVTLAQYAVHVQQIRFRYLALVSHVSLEQFLHQAPPLAVSHVQSGPYTAVAAA